MTAAALFEDVHLSEAAAPNVELSGPTLRAVYWGDDDRVHLVRCDAGERNVRRIRPLATLCGTSCADILRTSAIPPVKTSYCQTCHAAAGNGALR